jgi:hypothetical protein
MSDRERRQMTSVRLACVVGACSWALALAACSSSSNNGSPDSGTTFDASTVTDSGTEDANAGGSDSTVADAGNPSEEAGTADTGADGEAFSDAGDGGIASLDGGADASPCVLPPSGLVGWWPGNGNANDIVGGDNGAFTGAYATGKVDRAFSVASSQYVSVPTTSTLNPTAISIETWFLRTTPSGLADPIVTKGGEASSTAHGYTLEFGGYAGGNSAQQVFFYVYTGGTATGAGAPGWQSSPGKLVATGSWVQAVGVYDGSQLGLYVNGTLVGFSAASGPIVASGNPLGFGHNYGSGATNRAFVGLIDEVSIYNRALTATEVKALYMAGSAGKCTSDLSDAGAISDSSARDAASDATSD